jgi:hypothetical protein
VGGQQALPGSGHQHLPNDGQLATVHGRDSVRLDRPSIDARSPGSCGPTFEDRIVISGGWFPNPLAGRQYRRLLV